MSTPLIQSEDSDENEEEDRYVSDYVVCQRENGMS